MSEERCKAMVSHDAWHRSGCSRKAVRDGYCGQHHPDAEKARREASERRWEEQRKADATARERAAIALLTRLGYAVTPPAGARPEGEAR